MASQRTRDRWVGALLGALGLLVLLVAVAVVAFLLLSRPVSPDADPSPDLPPPPVAGTPTPPSDLGAGTTWLGDVDLDAGRLLTSQADLRDVTARGTDLVTGPDGTRAGTLEVEATVPFGVVADQLGPGTSVGPAEAGGASVRRTVEVLGREVDVVATGTVEARGGRIVVEPRTIDVGGPLLLAEAIGAATVELVTIEQDVEGLPPGLVLREVTVTDDGFRARLDGTDVLVAPVVAPR